MTATKATPHSNGHTNAAVPKKAAPPSEPTALKAQVAALKVRVESLETIVKKMILDQVAAQLAPQLQAQAMAQATAQFETQGLEGLAAAISAGQVPAAPQ